MTDSGLVTVRSQHSFTDTAQRLEAALDERGLTVFARIDHAAGAKAQGLDLKPTLLLIFGSARAGTPVMQALRASGLDLPLKALIWEDAEGRAWLTYNQPEWIAARHGAGPGEVPAVSLLSGALAGIVGEAVGDESPRVLIDGAATCHDRGPGKIQAQLIAGGVSFPADEPIAAGGGATGPSPHDLLAAGLAACTTLTLRLYADRKAWP
ncbi:MAG: DUF302 domain-containing protein, partial [Caulobacteraceae bacterium]